MVGKEKKNRHISTSFISNMYCHDIAIARCQTQPTISNMLQMHPSHTHWEKKIQYKRPQKSTIEDSNYPVHMWTNILKYQSGCTFFPSWLGKAQCEILFPVIWVNALLCFFPFSRCKLQTSPFTEKGQQHRP